MSEWYEENWRERETPAFVEWFDALPLAGNLTPEADAYWHYRAACLNGWRGFALAAAARGIEAGEPQTYAGQLARLGWDLAAHVVDNGHKLADNFVLRTEDGAPLMTVAVAIGPDAHLLTAGLMASQQAASATPESLANRQALLDQWPAVKGKLEAMILRIEDTPKAEGDGTPA